MPISRAGADFEVHDDRMVEGRGDQQATARVHIDMY